ncbi:MAG TPA: hypothetical protein VH500_10410 [Nitrososphaeraceae archaeon]
MGYKYTEPTAVNPYQKVIEPIYHKGYNPAQSIIEEVLNKYSVTTVDKYYALNFIQLQYNSYVETT